MDVGPSRRQFPAGEQLVSVFKRVRIATAPFAAGSSLKTLVIPMRCQPDGSRSGAVSESAIDNDCTLFH